MEREIDLGAILAKNMAALEEEKKLNDELAFHRAAYKRVHPTKRLPYLAGTRGECYTEFTPVTIQDKLNYTCFYATFTPTYTPVPDAYLSGMRPIYSAGKLDPDEAGVLTVMGMLDLISQGSPFKLCNMEDAYKIRDLLNEWLEVLALNEDKSTTADIAREVSRKTHIRQVTELRDMMSRAIDLHEHRREYYDPSQRRKRWVSGYGG